MSYAYEVYGWVHRPRNAASFVALLGTVELPFPFFEHRTSINQRRSNEQRIEDAKNARLVEAALVPLVEASFGRKVIYQKTRSGIRTAFFANHEEAATKDRRFKNFTVMNRWYVTGLLEAEPGDTYAERADEATDYAIESQRPVLSVAFFVQPPLSLLRDKDVAARSPAMFVAPGSVENNAYFQPSMRYDSRTAHINHGNLFSLQSLLTDYPELTVRLDELLEKGLAGVRNQYVAESAPKDSSYSPYSYISFDKVRVGPTEDFRKRYGGRASWKKLSFTVEVRKNWRGEYVFTFSIDDLGWYGDPTLTARLQQLATSDTPVALVNNSKEYLLQPEDRGPFAVWLDQLIERGLLPTRYTDDGTLEGTPSVGAGDVPVFTLVEGTDFTRLRTPDNAVTFKSIELRPITQELLIGTFRDEERWRFIRSPRYTQNPKHDLYGKRIAADILFSFNGLYQLINGEEKSFEDYTSASEVKIQLTPAARLELQVWVDELLSTGWLVGRS